jgi:hypothetical protein
MAGPPAGARAWLERVFGIDPRSLAALRIGFGAILAVDLAFRAEELRASYTDAGPLPRALLDPWLTETIAPLHMLSGSFAWEATLFAVAFVAALALLVGYQTRIAAVVSWLLLLSLQARNPLLLNFGDDILRVCLFWAIFLPLGRCWSIDAARAGEPPSLEPVCSMASAAFLLQVFLIYLFTALLKTGADWHEDGTALYYAMQLDWLVQPLGIWLREHFELTRLLTWSTLVLETVGPFLLLAPFWPVRLAAALGFAGLHVGISATLRLGVFPWIDVTILMAFVPREAWDLVGRWVPGAARPEAAPHPAPPARAPLARARAIALALLLAYVVAHNTASAWPALQLPDASERALRWIGLRQRWLMFTPNVTRDDGWFVIPSRLADGRILDVSPHGPALHWEKPPLLSADFSSARWARYLHQISNREANGSLRRAYVRWLCREWNGAHAAPEQIEPVDVYFVREHSELPGVAQEVQPFHLASHDCPHAGERPSPGWDVAVPESGTAPAPLVEPASMGRAETGQSVRRR